MEIRWDKLGKPKEHSQTTDKYKLKQNWNCVCVAADDGTGGEWKIWETKNGIYRQEKRACVHRADVCFGVFEIVNPIHNHIIYFNL